MQSQQSVTGRLDLNFTYNTALQSTKLTHCVQHPPLKVIRAFPLDAGGALVHLHNISGGVLGGDQLALTVDVGPEAYTQLTSTSATRLYRSRSAQQLAQQTTTVRVQEGGLLEYLPDPLIPFAGSRYQQHTQIRLEADAGLFWWEIIAPGRVAHGELFAYDLLKTAMMISTPERPLAQERFTLEPQRFSLSSLARLGQYTYMCSFYICRIGIAASTWLHLEQALSELAQELHRPTITTWGVSALVAHGLVVRALSIQGRDISTGLYTFWQTAKQALYGRDAVAPRKIY